MYEQDKESASLKSLFATLSDETYRLYRQEFQLARAEIKASFTSAFSGLVAVFAGGLMAFAALLILLQALVVALANVMPPSIAALIVGAGTAVVALLVVQHGTGKLEAANLAPERTIRALRKDTKMVKEQLT